MLSRFSSLRRPTPLFASAAHLKMVCRPQTHALNAVAQGSRSFGSASPRTTFRGLGPYRGASQEGGLNPPLQRVVDLNKTQRLGYLQSETSKTRKAFPVATIDLATVSRCTASAHVQVESSRLRGRACGQRGCDPIDPKSVCAASKGKT